MVDPNPPQAGASAVVSNAKAPHGPPPDSKRLCTQRAERLQPLADNIGSLGPDLLMRGTDDHRAGSNSYLSGY